MACARPPSRPPAQAISTAWPDSRVVLEKLRGDLNTSLEKLTTREKFLNEQFDRQMQQYRAQRIQLQDIQVGECVGVCGGGGVGGRTIRTSWWASVWGGGGVGGGRTIRTSRWASVWLARTTIIIIIIISATGLRQRVGLNRLNPEPICYSWLGDCQSDVSHP